TALGVARESRRLRPDRTVAISRRGREAGRALRRAPLRDRARVASAGLDGRSRGRSLSLPPCPPPAAGGARLSPPAPEPVLFRSRRDLLLRRATRAAAVADADLPALQGEARAIE